jgi:hypothetical protein
VPDWLSDNLKDAVEASVKPAIQKAQEAIQATKDRIENLQHDVQMMCDQLPSKAERKKNRLTMLQLALTARTLAAEYFDGAISESMALRGPRQGAISTAKDAVKKILVDAEFDTRVFDWTNAVDSHPLVKAARTEAQNVTSFIELTNDRSRTNQSRLGGVKTEIEKIRDSLARELMEV